jgi:hypothetical protein
VIHVFGPSGFQPTSGIVVDVSHTGKDEFRFLSPLTLEPVGGQAKNLENLWQFSLLYEEYTDAASNPTTAYYTWRNAGFSKNHGVRNPLGDRKPLGALWHGKKMDLVSARHTILIPQYTAAVLNHCSGQILKLKNMLEIYQDIHLYADDGYDHLAYDMTLAEVVQNVDRPLSHAFILASMISGEVL